MKAGAVVWFTGLPASGKSTLARRVAGRLRPRPVLLDSDEVRAALGVALGFGPRSRRRFYLLLARLAALFASQGQVVLVAATAHRRAWRAQAKRLAPRFVEVYVAAPIETCIARDPKGLYRLAARGKIAALPGVGAKFEPPLKPAVVARGGQDAAALKRLVALINARTAG